MKFLIAGTKKKEEEPLEFSIDIDGDGDVVLSVVKGDYDTANLLYIDVGEGKVQLYSGISEDLGLQVDAQGYLIVGR